MFFSEFTITNAVLPVAHADFQTEVFNFCGSQKGLVTFQDLTIVEPDHPPRPK